MERLKLQYSDKAYFNKIIIQNSCTAAFFFNTVSCLGCDIKYVLIIDTFIIGILDTFINEKCNKFFSIFHYYILIYESQRGHQSVKNNRGIESEKIWCLSMLQHMF